MPRAYLPAIAWTCAILAACSIPGNDIPDIDFDLFEEDKIVHFSLFLVFGWLWARALPYSFTAGFACLGLAGIAYGIGTELYQSMLPWDRTADPMDAIANILGLFTALMIYSWRDSAKD